MTNRSVSQGGFECASSKSFANHRSLWGYIPIFAGALVAAASFSTSIDSVSATPTGSTVAEEMNGPWRVGCSRDNMTDKVVCSLQSGSNGPGIFGPTTLSLIITSSDKNAAPALALNIPIMNLRAGVTYRLDSGEPRSVTCDAISGNMCIIQGQARTQWINDMARASNVVVRVQDQYGKPYDFPFDPKEFGRSMQTFNTYVSTYIR